MTSVVQTVGASKMFIRRVKGKPDLYVVQGEHENNEFFAQWSRDKLDVNDTALNESGEFNI